MPGRVIFTPILLIQMSGNLSQSSAHHYYAVTPLGIVVTPRCNASLCSPHTFCRPLPVQFLPPPLLHRLQQGRGGGEDGSGEDDDEEEDKEKLEVEDEGVDDEDEVGDEEVWGPWLPAGPSGGLISGMCASLASSSSRSSSTSSSKSFSPRSLKGSLFKSKL